MVQIMPEFFGVLNCSIAFIILKVGMGFCPPIQQCDTRKESATEHILGNPGALSRDDRMFVAKVYYKIDLTVNFRHGHSIVPINCPWVSEDPLNKAD